MAKWAVTWRDGYVESTWTVDSPEEVVDEVRNILVTGPKYSRDPITKITIERRN